MKEVGYNLFYLTHPLPSRPIMRWKGVGKVHHLVYLTHPLPSPHEMERDGRDGLRRGVEL